MPWTITESAAPQTPVKPPVEPVRWDAVPVGAWVWCKTSGFFAFKKEDGRALCAGEVCKMLDHEHVIPCPPDWRFEARVVDGSLRFVPMVEGEREDEWFAYNSVDLDEGDLIQNADGGWYVATGVGNLACLVFRGISNSYRMPRGPVTLTYTPPTE